MLVVAVRAGIVFAVILAIFGVVETHPLTDMLMLFMTAGMIPGTSIQIPPDMMLILTALCLICITLLVYRQYVAYQSTLDSVLQEYTRVPSDDEPDVVPFPRLYQAIMDARSALADGQDVWRILQFWVKSLGRPVIAQAVTVHEELYSSLVKLDDWMASLRPGEKLNVAGDRLLRWALEGDRILNDWTERTRSEIIRLFIR